MRPGIYLAWLAGLFVAIYLFVFFMGTGGKGFSERLEPRLGLDLVGGTQVRLEAISPDGKPPTDKNLQTANIVVSLAGKTDDRLKDIGDAAELRFRKVLKQVPDQPADTEPTPTPTAKPSGTAKPSATAKAPATTTPTATPTPGGSTPPSPAASPSAGATRLTNDQLLAVVKQKIGPAAWAAASKLTAPAQPGDPTLAKFATLSPREVAVLPANIQFYVPQITCEKQLDKRPPGSIRDEKVQAVACESGAKYLLDVAKVLGTDVSDANAVLDQQDGWVVNLEFSSEGADKWEGLTRESLNNTGKTEADKCAQDALGNNGHCRVAVVLDNEVVSSPQIEAVTSSSSRITGKFTQAEANKLASQLRYGALPLTFEPQQAQTLTAKLGSDHLRAGLLAAGIGMLLVVIYAFFYYRLLGSVIFLSLVLSGLLVFGMLIVLGRSVGFTLTLAGIAGFIVSLGVAADSFVIYFERLKDEIRDGRSPRSAVPRAWARARRTILTANAISILAAVVLYLFSVGAVRGFAFALGMATLLDLIVVFLFRHPIMTMFAGTRAFLSPRVSGLGRVLQRETDADAAPARGRGPRVKEA
jgi:preprotein translocase subunit SecD